MPSLMADGRTASLRDQAIDAGLTHLQMKTPPSEQQLKSIISFECQIYVAQSSDAQDVSVDTPGTQSGLGPNNLSLALQISTYLAAPRKESLVGNMSVGTFGQNYGSETEFRNSVARGAQIFFHRTFSISDAAGFNRDGQPITGTCVSCHDVPYTGESSAHWIDTGSTNLPWATDRKDLPLFKITCTTGSSQPYLGKEILTQDPGRALVTGKCADVGKIGVQDLRALASRAPYFSNGSASTLADVVSFYDRRFGIHFTRQEGQDLENFLSLL